MKKEDLNFFIKDFRFRQDVSDEIQTSIFLGKMSFKPPLKLIYPVKIKGMGMDLKYFFL